MPSFIAKLCAVSSGHSFRICFIIDFDKSVYMLMMWKDKNVFHDFVTSLHFVMVLSSIPSKICSPIWGNLKNISSMVSLYENFFSCPYLYLDPLSLNFLGQLNWKESAHRILYGLISEWDLNNICMPVNQACAGWPAVFLIFLENQNKNNDFGDSSKKNHKQYFFLCFICCFFVVL